MAVRFVSPHINQSQDLIRVHAFIGQKSLSQKIWSDQLPSQYPIGASASPGAMVGYSACIIWSSMAHLHHSPSAAAYRPEANFSWIAPCGLSWPRVVLAALLGLSVAVLLPLGFHNVAARSDWAIADWLINYSGGFVRRGLTGSLALLASRAGISPPVAILGLQLALYAVMLATVWHLLRPVRWTVPLLALVFSPATLQFPLMDPSFAFRKEILFFALLSCLLLLLTRRRRPALPVIILLTIGCSLCVLSHEALLVFFPYLLAALCLALPSLKQAIAWFALPALVSAMFFVAVSHHPGTVAISQAVCSSLGSSLQTTPSSPTPDRGASVLLHTGPGLCGGAIAYLSRPPSYARSEVQRVAQTEHYNRVMPTLITLALLPILLQLHSTWRAGKHREVQIITFSLCVSSAASVSLFIYGTDWTRWIYIHAFSLMLLLLFVASQYSGGLHREEVSGSAALNGSPVIRTVSAIFLLAYIFAWHLSLYQPKIPLGGLIHYLRKT